jgi:hypothetical protein
MIGSVLIRAHENSLKVMNVEFYAGTDDLKINMLKFIEGRTQVFELCNLKYDGLGGCWFWDTNEMFLIGALDKNIMFHEIYCWPLDATRNQWLNFFERKKVRTMSVLDAVFKHGRYFPRRSTKLPTIIENTVSEITPKGLKNAEVKSFTGGWSAKSAQTASAHNQRLRSTKPQIDNNLFGEPRLLTCSRARPQPVVWMAPACAQISVRDCRNILASPQPLRYVWKN